MPKLLLLLVVLLAKSVTCLAAEQAEVSEISEFSVATYKSTRLICATTMANRSCTVRSKAQCVKECQHGGQTTCVGVNYRELSNTCEIYYQCPTNYCGNIAGCQYMQKETNVGQLFCPVYVAPSLSQYQYVPSNNCSYPFTYNGTLYYNCMPTQTEYCGVKACLVSNRQYVLCYSPADYQVQLTSINLTVSSQPQVTLQSVFDWIVIQQRIPTVGTAYYNWQQGWSSYKNGFGNSDSNFWLGLERMNLLTCAASYQLRVEVQQASTGMWFSAEYLSFTVGAEAGSWYQLSVSGHSKPIHGSLLFPMGRYTGDAGDSLQWTGDWNGDGCFGHYLHNGMKFTTYDQDNDNFYANCATARGGGWWYNQCYCTCPTCDDAHAVWSSLGLLSSKYMIKASRMMMKLNA